MSSGEPMFDDDADVTLQNCHFIPRHLEYNQVPFVRSPPHGATLSPLLPLAPTLHARIELISSLVFFPSFPFHFLLPPISPPPPWRVTASIGTINRVVDRVKDFFNVRELPSLRIILLNGRISISRCGTRDGFCGLFLIIFFFRAEIPLIRFLCFLCSGVSKITRYFFFIGIVHGLIFH